MARMISVLLQGGFSERPSIEGTDPETFSIHVQRYEFAKRFGGSRVLDVGCGIGYGVASYKMADTRVGCDINLPSLNAARKRFGSNTDFVCADAQALPFRSKTFELTLSFEVLEHLANPNAALCELQRVCKQNGIVVLSTPNKLMVSPIGRTPFNPYHSHEFTRYGLVNSASATGLRILSLLGQEWYPIIHPLYTALQQILFRTIRVRFFVNVSFLKKVAVASSNRKIILSDIRESRGHLRIPNTLILVATPQKPTLFTST
jgi:ubiquinone/menaquinone biosynthesis C-methylase UbiE